MKIVMVNLLDWLSQLKLLKKLTVALVFYSLVMLFWAWDAGVLMDADLKGGQEFEGYLGKINWSLSPVWWLFLALLVHLSWTPFVAAWQDLHGKGMLLASDGKPASAQQVNAFCSRLDRYRVGFVPIAFVLSYGITFFDTEPLRNIYDTCEKGDINFVELAGRLESESKIRNCEEVTNSILRELNRACGLDDLTPGSASTELQDNDPDGLKCEATKRALKSELEIDFNIAYLVEDQTLDGSNIGPIEKEQNHSFNRAAYFQQIVIGALSALAFFQLMLLCFLFWRLEKSAWLNPEGLKLVLDPFSKLYEYGLESWNHALNNVYWVFSLALLVPLASRYSQSSEALDFGQMFLQLVIPGIIAMPMLATIIARQQRQRDLWPKILAEEDPDRVALYHRQLLWPLDRNWASKLGIIISFVLLSYLLGRNLLSLAS